MKTVTHTNEDRIYPSVSDIKIIKDFMDDDRVDIDYLDGWDNLMAVFEVISDTLPVKTSMTSRGWSIEHKYQKFHESYMYHDYRTRKSSLFLIIVKFLKWYNLDDRLIIDKHYEWLSKQ